MGILAPLLGLDYVLSCKWGDRQRDAAGHRTDEQNWIWAEGQDCYVLGNGSGLFVIELGPFIDLALDFGDDGVETGIFQLLNALRANLIKGSPAVGNGDAVF